MSYTYTDPSRDDGKELTILNDGTKFRDLDACRIMARDAAQRDGCPCGIWQDAGTGWYTYTTVAMEQDTVGPWTLVAIVQG